MCVSDEKFSTFDLNLLKNSIYLVCCCSVRDDGVTISKEK